MSVFNGMGVEIVLPTPDSFLKVKETLTRIGIASKQEKKLSQTAHILHKKDKQTSESHYAILHFKELFKLDGKNDTLTEEDISRRNTIVNLLVDWGLVDLYDNTTKLEPVASINKVKIISFKEKLEWNLVSKYSIGTKKNNT